jgi:hypothetical protein
MFRTQYIPDFFVAEHYVLGNTSSWWGNDLASFSMILYIKILWLMNFVGLQSDLNSEPVSLV